MNPLSLQPIRSRLADIAPHLTSTSYGRFRGVGCDTNLFVLGKPLLTLSTEVQEVFGHACPSVFVQRVGAHSHCLGLTEEPRTFQKERFSNLTSNELAKLIELHLIVAEAVLQQIDLQGDVENYLKKASDRTLIAAILFKKVGTQICATNNEEPDEKVNPKILQLYKTADTLTDVLEEFLNGLSDHDPEVLDRFHSCERAFYKLLIKYAKSLKIDRASLEDNRRLNLNQEELSRACEQGKYKALSANELLLLGVVYLVTANLQINNTHTLFNTIEYLTANESDDCIEEVTEFKAYADSFITGAQYMFYLASEKTDKETAQNN